MFNNIGKKIKTLAEIICWLGIIFSVLFGLGNIFSDKSGLSLFTGLFLMIVGPLISWIGTFLLYGFGQLIENSDILVNLSYDKKYNNDYICSNCPECGAEISTDDNFCKSCGCELND